jgi:signal transduction histidine kinase
MDDHPGRVRPHPAGAGLALRLVSLGLLSALATSLVAGLVLRNRVHDEIWQAFVRSLDERQTRVLARIERNRDGHLVHAESGAPDEFSRIFSGWYWRLDDGTKTLRSRSLWDADLEPIPDARIREGVRAEGPQGDGLLGLRREVALEGGGNAQLAILGPAAPIEDAIARFDRGLAGTLLALVVTLLLATGIQVRLGLRPVRRLRLAVTDAAGGRRESVGGGYGPDLDPLAGELDRMFERNARIVARARGNAADLAHALKKPLSILLAASTSGVTAVPATQVQAQVRSMSGLIDRHLARAGSGAGERRRVAVDERIAALIELMRQLHAVRALEWQVVVEPGLDWRGEATDLDEMLGNLLDNAGKWASRQVAVRASRVADWVRIEIGDDGEGLSEVQRAAAVERGQRFDEAVEGSGLGLAITSDIARTYGGSLRLAASALGGLEAVLELPD